MYINWNEKTITDFSDSSIEKEYQNGYVFTRLGKGIMNQTRSLRVDLKNFKFSSENRRVLKKNIELKVESEKLPLPEDKYSYKYHKLAKEFYQTKFGKGTMTASKIKELLTDPDKSNFNFFPKYSMNNEEVGYCICLVTNNIIHYSYPFYNLEYDKTSLGIAMMTMMVEISQNEGKKYIYLGSYTGKESKYKLQFKGIEWFDGKKWSSNIEALKSI